VADITFLAYDAAVAADMLAVVASKAALGGKMPYVVWMCLPIRFHFREKIGLIDALHLGNGIGEDGRIL